MPDERLLVQAHVERDLYDKLGQVATNAQVSRADVVRKAMDKFIEDFESKHGKIKTKRIEL